MISNPNQEMKYNNNIVFSDMCILFQFGQTFVQRNNITHVSASRYCNTN